MAKVPYEKPQLRHLGLLRELTKLSGWSDGGGDPWGDGDPGNHHGRHWWWPWW